MMAAQGVRGMERIDPQNRHATLRQVHAGGCTGGTQTDNDNVMVLHRTSSLP
jgi:hypothetical protein